MKKLLSIIIGIMLFFPINVLALDVSPSLTCDKTTLKMGEQATCKFKVYVTGGKMSGISAPYTYENEYAIVKVEKESMWEGNANGNSMDFYGYNDYSGNVSIATIIYKVKEDAVISNDVTSNLTINVKEVAGENNVANTYDNKTSTVKFNILKKVVTTCPTTQKVETTTTTTKKPTTTKKSVVTKKTTTKTTTTSTTTSTSIEETTTTTTEKIESTKKTTTRYEKPEKKLNVGVIVFLGLFLLLLLLGIILTVREIIKNKEEQ